MKKPQLSALLLAGLCAVGTVAVGQVASQAPAEVPLGPPPGNIYAELPDMGSGANAMISRADEYQVGRMMLRSLRDENAILEDPESAEYIQSLGSRIGAQAQDGNVQLSFFVVRDLGVNAFAMPGGFIAIHAGLILLTSHESELAGVVAHEIGHVVQRHLARAIQAQSRQSLSTMAAMLGAILVGAISGNPDAVMGGIAMAQGTALQQQMNFTRMEEHEADRVGIGFMAAAEYDPNAMAGFFSTMGRNEGVSLSSLPDLLRSHPVTSERVAEARARAAQFPARRARPDAPSYAMIRERIRVITSAPEADLRPYYARLKANGLSGLELDYGAALAELQVGDAASAVKHLKTLRDQNPGNTLLHGALGQAQMAAGQPDAALATFARAQTLFPRNVPICVRYAEALIRAAQPEQAHQLLLDVFNNTVPTPEQIRLTALAASGAGDMGDAYYYMSEYHISSGDLMLATQQLDMALAAPNLTEVQQKRYQARREEIRGYLREQRHPKAQRTSNGP